MELTKINTKLMTEKHQPDHIAGTRWGLENLGLLKISGSGAHKLLQGQLTCDVDQVSARGGIMGAHCNPQGRVISLFAITKMDDAFYLVMPRQLLDIAAQALKKYAPFYKAELADATDVYQILGVQNHDDLQQHAAAVIHLPEPATRSILIMTSGQTASNNSESWQLLDILDGIPSIYPATSGAFLPHDLNLPNLKAVSFTKGCYTGQEIIARMQYRGKPKKHLYPGFSETPLEPGETLTVDEHPAAVVVVCSNIRYNNQYPLLLVTDDNSAASGRLQTKEGCLIQMNK